MSTFYKLYIYSGRALRPLLLPLTRFFIRSTRRAYVVIYKDDEVLLTKNWLGDGRYALPGGGVHKGESNETAIYREVEEELGADLKGMKFKHIVKGRWQTDNLGFIYNIYSLNYDLQKIKTRKLEIVEASWQNVSQLSETNCMPEVLRAIRNT